MKTKIKQTAKGPVGPKMSALAKVEIGQTHLSKDRYTPIVSSTNKYKMDEAHLILKPLSHFKFDLENECYVLNINVHVGDGYSLDANNAVECLSSGGTLLIFLNYSKASKTGNVPTSLFNYRIEFKEDITKKIKGKRLLIVTSSGDPEEGSAAQVIVEDEDEI